MRACAPIPLLLAMALQVVAGTARADPLLDPLVQGDPDAEALVMALQAAYPGAVIEVDAKHESTSSLNGSDYTLLKLTVDDADTTASIRDGSAVVQLDGDLMLDEEAALVASLPPVYGKMSRSLQAQLAAVQGGVLGGAGGLTETFEVQLEAETVAGLDAIEAALGAIPSQRFDAEALLTASPPILRDGLDGSPPAPFSPSDVQFRAISVTLSLSDLLTFGALAEVRQVDLHSQAALGLSTSVPQVRGDEVHEIGILGEGTTIAIIDSGIDDTHPSFQHNGSTIVVAEAAFVNADAPAGRCDSDQSICFCAGGFCNGSVCVGGSNDGQACVTTCPDDGTCDGTFGDYVGHGTAVAGCASNLDANQKGMTRPAALINAAASKEADGLGLKGLVGGMFFAKEREADVVNMSFGLGHFCRAPAEKLKFPCETDADCDVDGDDGDCIEMDGDGTHLLSRLTDFFSYRENIVMVTSVGNEGSLSTNEPSPPADAYNAITVGISSVNEGPFILSTPGPTKDGRSKPEVIAPGTSIESMAHDWEGPTLDIADRQAGSSLSAPHVSGLASLLIGWGDDPCTQPREPCSGIFNDTPYLRATIVNTADRKDFDPEGRVLDKEEGAGEIDAYEAFLAFSDDFRVWQQTVEGTTLPHSDWYYVDVTEDEVDTELTFTLAWELRIVNPLTPPRLNDLDLRIYGPDGTVLDASSSRVDSLEHLVFTPAAEGRYCIEVDPRRLPTDGKDLYALASTPLQLRHTGNRFPCRPDFGDAPDPGHPTLLANDGARHLDWTKEWLGGSAPEVPGEVDKMTEEVRTRVLPMPSVSGESDALDNKDEDGVNNLDDADGLDDGVVLPPFWTPNQVHTIAVTVSSTVNRTGFGDYGRYQSSNSDKRIYVNAWADWNDDGSWAPGEKILGTGSAVGPVVFDPESFGPNQEYTLGESYGDDNFTGKWEPGESYSDTAGAPTKTDTYQVTAPAVIAPVVWVRVRLDYGENLDSPTGAAATGEVEDYETFGTADSTGCTWDEGCGVALWSESTCWEPPGACSPYPDNGGISTFTVTVQTTPAPTIDVDVDVDDLYVPNAASTITVAPSGDLNVTGPAQSTNLGAVHVDGTCSFGSQTLVNGFGATSGLLEVDDGGSCTLAGTDVQGGGVRVEAGGALSCNGCTLELEESEVLGVVHFGNPIARIGAGRPGGAGWSVGSGGVLQVGNGVTVQVEDGVDLQVDGALTCNSAGATTTLQLLGESRLTGSGSVALPHVACYVGGVGGSFVLDGPTLSGCGAVGLDQAALAFDGGLVDADASCGALALDPGDATGATFDTTLQARDGGKLLLRDGSFTAGPAGDLRSKDQGEIELFNAIVTGGAAEVEPDGQLDQLNSTLDVLGFDVRGDHQVRGVSTLGGPTAGARTYMYHPGSTGNIQANQFLQLADQVTLDLQDAFTVSSAGGTTDLILLGTSTLTGGGPLRLIGTQAGVSGPGGVLNVQGTTIEGQGALGRDAVQFTYDTASRVHANVSGGTLDFNPADGTPSTVPMPMEATGGARLLLRDGSFDMGATGSLVADDQSEVELSSATVTGGTADVQPGGQLDQLNSTLDVLGFDVRGDHQVRGVSTLGGPTAGARTYTYHPGSTGNIQANQFLQLADQVTLDLRDAFTVSSIGGLTDVILLGTATLTGGGPLRLNGSQAGVSGSGGVLNVQGTAIEGQGALGRDGVQFTYDTASRITADVSGGTLTFNPADGVASDVPIPMDASGGGRLDFRDGLFALSGNGSVRANDQSTVGFISATLEGGTVEVLPGGTIDQLNSVLDVFNLVVRGTHSVRGVSQWGGPVAGNRTYTLVAGSDVRVEANQFLRLADQLALLLQGDLRMESIGGLTDVQTLGTATLLGGGGRVVLSGSQAGISGPGGTIVGTQVPIEGQGAVGRDQVRFLFDAASRITANVPGGTLTVNPVDTSASSFPMPLEARQGARLQLWDGEFPGGQVRAFDQSEVEVVTSTLEGGSVRVDAGGLLDQFQSVLDVPQLDVYGEHQIRGVSQLGGPSTGPVSYTYHPGSIGNVQANQFLQLADGVTLQLLDVFTLSSIGGLTDLQALGTATLSGTGTLQMNGSQAGVSGGGLLVLAGPTIEGQGAIGRDTTRLQLDSGRIVADRAGLTLTLDTPDAPASTYAVPLESTNGARLYVFDSNLVSQVGGEVLARGGEVEILNSTIDMTIGSGMRAEQGGGTPGFLDIRTATIIGNTISSDAVSTVSIAETVTLEDVSIQANAVQQNGSTVNLTGDLDAGQTYAVNGINLTTTVNIASPTVALRGGGEMIFSDSSVNRVGETVSGNTLVLEDATLRGSAQINAPLRIETGGIAIATGSYGLRLNRPIQLLGSLRSDPGSQIVVSAPLSGSGRVAGVGPISIGPVTAVTTSSWRIDDAFTIAGGSAGGRNVSFGPAAAFTLGSSLEVDGVLSLEMTDESDWSLASDGVVHLTGGVGAAPGNWASWGQLEVAGSDLGIDPVTHAGNPAGFSNNFEIPELRIGPGARVFLRDVHDNGNGGPGAEALYIDTLVFEDGTGLLNTNGIPLYFNSFTGAPAQVSNTAVPQGGAPDGFVLEGVAQGGAVSLKVAGVLITVTTTAGQTAAQVLQAIADAINADPVLQGLGITASVVGDELVVNGPITELVIDDAGLSSPAQPKPIDALSPGLQLLTAALLALLALRFASGRARTAG